MPDSLFVNYTAINGITYMSTYNRWL